MLATEGLLDNAGSMVMTNALMHFTKQGIDKPPNGLGMSRAALIDRQGGRADSTCQNAADLGAAQRRRIHARVGRQPSLQRRKEIIADDSIAFLEIARSPSHPVAPNLAWT